MGSSDSSLQSLDSSLISSDGSFKGNLEIDYADYKEFKALEKNFEAKYKRLIAATVSMSIMNPDISGSKRCDMSWQAELHLRDTGLALWKEFAKSQKTEWCIYANRKLVSELDEKTRKISDFLQFPGIQPRLTRILITNGIVSALESEFSDFMFEDKKGGKLKADNFTYVVRPHGDPEYVDDLTAYEDITWREWEARKLAIAMSSHKRLGSGSWMNLLSKDILQKIVTEVQSE